MMNYIHRVIENRILESISKGKVVILFGPRRVGKTLLVNKILPLLGEPYLFLNGEDMEHNAALQIRSTANYLRLLGTKRLLVIDEAQAIPDIGMKLKLMVDTIPGLKIIATGSSAFDLNNTMGEPLVGRKIDFDLFPLAQMEFGQKEDYLQTLSNLDERLIFGGYPELIHISNREDKINYLKSLISSYLLKDLISFEGIKKRDKIFKLLQIIAYRVGSEISMESIGNELQISKNTVDKYLDLLSKVFVIHKLTGFSRNLDNEITKKSKWYFYDNGVRNAIISNFNPLNNRDDTGKLWENYIISERIKYLRYHKIDSNNFFWRNKNKQELDWLEEREGKLFAYEIKWNTNVRAAPPAAWRKAYPDAEFKLINPDNYLDFIT